MRQITALFVSALFSTAAAAIPPAKTDEELIASLRCPETYTDQRSYYNDMAAFIAGARLNHPDWTNQQLADFRFVALKAHGCAASKE